MGREIVDLNELTTTRQVADFNARMIPETRLSNVEFLKWKYRTVNRQGNKFVFHYGILADGQIVAQISTQSMTVWMNNKWESCSYWGDWFVDPKYKGLGFYLLNFILSENESLLASSGSDEAYNIYRRRKFHLLPIDSRFVYVVKPLSSVVSTRQSPRKAGSLAKAWLKSSLSHIPRLSLDKGLNFEEANDLHPSLLSNWQDSLPESTIFVRRERWMFDWFLKDFPYPEFKLITLNLGTTQIGYVLMHVRTQENGLVEGKIVDLFSIGWNEKNLLALFTVATRALKDLGVHIISYHATHPIYIALAERLGFTKLHDREVILYGQIAEVMASSQSNLHITFYDHDEAYY